MRGRASDFSNCKYFLPLRSSFYVCGKRCNMAGRSPSRTVNWRVDLTLHCLMNLTAFEVLQLLLYSFRDIYGSCVFCCMIFESQNITYDISDLECIDGFGVSLQALWNDAHIYRLHPTYGLCCFCLAVLLQYQNDLQYQNSSLATFRDVWGKRKCWHMSKIMLENSTFKKGFHPLVNNQQETWRKQSSLRTGIYSSNLLRAYRTNIIKRNRNHRGKQSLLILMGFFPWPRGRSFEFFSCLCFQISMFSRDIRKV